MRKVVVYAIAAIMALLTVSVGSSQSQLAPGNGILPPPRGQRGRSGFVAPPKPVYSIQKVTLNVNGELRPALDALFGQTRVNYLYAFRTLPAGKAHIQVTRRPFDEALSTLLRAYPTRPPIRTHVTGNVLSLMQIDMQRPEKDGKKLPVTLRLKDARLQDAFRSLFAALGTDYLLDPDIQGRVTLTFRDASYRDVLRTLIAQSPQPLNLVDRGNSIIIKIVKPHASEKGHNEKKT